MLVWVRAVKTRAVLGMTIPLEQRRCAETISLYDIPGRHYRREILSPRALEPLSLPPAELGLRLGLGLGLGLGFGFGFGFGLGLRGPRHPDESCCAVQALAPAPPHPLTGGASSHHGAELFALFLEGATKGPSTEYGVGSNEQRRNQGGGADDHETAQRRQIGGARNGGDDGDGDRHCAKAQRAQRGEEGKA